MTNRDDAIEKMQEVSLSISEQTYEDLSNQSKKAAANFFLLYEDAATPAGVVSAVIQGANAALLWLLSEGYVELTDKARAPEDELARKREQRKAVLDKAGSAKPATPLPGSYL